MFDFKEIGSGNEYSITNNLKRNNLDRTAEVHQLFFIIILNELINFIQKYNPIIFRTFFPFITLLRYIF